jgi:hypothetical protein
VWTSVLLLACEAFPVEARRTLPDGDSADTASDSGPQDSAGAPVDTGGPDTDGRTMACYLGPDRLHDVCLPTVPWDASMGADYVWPEPLDAQYPQPTRLLDLERMDPYEALAPNFTLLELAEARKGRWAVVQPHLLERLQAMRDDASIPILLTSGFRSPAYNAAVGGVTWSRHQYGDAVDLDVEGWSVEEAGVLCEAHGASYIGLYEDGHTHCDWRDDPLDPVFYGASQAEASAARIVSAEARLIRDGASWTAPADGFDEGEPLRRWQALDAHGRLLVQARGRSFTPPADAARIDVVVGGHIHLSAPASTQEFR